MTGGVYGPQQKQRKKNTNRRGRVDTGYTGQKAQFCISCRGGGGFSSRVGKNSIRRKDEGNERISVIGTRGRGITTRKAHELCQVGGFRVLKKKKTTIILGWIGEELGENLGAKPSGGKWEKVYGQKQPDFVLWEKNLFPVRGLPP